MSASRGSPGGYSGDIRKCSAYADRNLWDFHPRAAFVMDDLRERILHEFGRVAPGACRTSRGQGWLTGRKCEAVVVGVRENG